jgi:hypothetical protein
VVSERHSTERLAFGIGFVHGVFPTPSHNKPKDSIEPVASSNGKERRNSPRTHSLPALAPALAPVLALAPALAPVLAPALRAGPNERSAHGNDIRRRRRKRKRRRSVGTPVVIGRCGRGWIRRRRRRHGRDQGAPAELGEQVALPELSEGGRPRLSQARRPHLAQLH